MRRLVLLSCLLLAGCDQGAPLTPVNKEMTVDPLTDINARLAFTCKHETIPEPSAESDMLFNYARWLQVNNQLKEDKAVDVEIARLYRIAAENGHAKAAINLQNGALRGRFPLSSAARLRLSQQLIEAKVATGYYFIALYLQHGAAGLAEDPEMALRYFRKAADEGSALAQAYVGDKLAWAGMAQIARQMRRCAAEQGNGEAARFLGVNLQGKGHYQEALEAFQLGVAAGDETSAGWLSDTFLGPEPTNTLDYMGQQKDPERARRYEIIWRILANYSYAHPTVPEINDIVPLPPAPLPAWDGKLQWLEAREANVPPPKPSEALIAELARNKQLNPATGRPLPDSPNFDNYEVALLCRSGEPCPKSGYWQVAQLSYFGPVSQEIRLIAQGDRMPTARMAVFHPRPWPLRDQWVQEERWTEWQFLGEA
jgi:hypothetical protein